MAKISNTQINLNKPLPTSSETVPEFQQNTVFNGKLGNYENTKLLESLGISSDQLTNILQQHPDFMNFEPSKQVQIVNQIKKQQVVVGNTDTITITSIEDVINYDDSSSYNQSDFGDALVKYFYTGNLTNEQKREILLVELVKAQYRSEGHSLEEFKQLVQNEAEYNALKQEMETFINQQVDKHKEHIQEDHILDEMFAKTLVSLQPINDEGKILSPKEFINALADKKSNFHKDAFDHYQDFVTDNWSGSDSHMANFLKVYGTKKEIMETFRKDLRNSEPEVFEELKKYGIELEDFSYISKIEDFNEKYTKFIKENPDLVKQSQFLQKNDTSEKIAFNVLQDKIDRGTKLTESEKKTYNIVSKLVEKQEARGLQGSKIVDENLITVEDFVTGEFRNQYSQCKSEEEKAEFIWKTIYSKYADENGKIPDEKRELFRKDLENFIASAQHAALYDFANNYLVPKKSEFTTIKEKEREYNDPWVIIDAEVAAETETLGKDEVFQYLQAAAGDTKQLKYFLDSVHSRSDAEDIIRDINSWASSNENLSSEAKQIYSEYAANTLTGTSTKSSANNTADSTGNDTRVMSSNQQVNPISSEKTSASSFQTSEQAIEQLNLNIESDKQKLVEIVQHDSSVLNRLDPKSKHAVLEVYCKRLDGAEIFELFMKNTSLYSELLNLAGEKLYKYKYGMLIKLLEESPNSLLKFAKELGIDLYTFAKHNKEYASKIAIATRNTSLADSILKNVAFYGLQKGSSDYFALIQLLQKENQNKTEGERPIYANHTTIDDSAKFLFNA